MMSRYYIDKVLHRLLAIKWHRDLDNQYRNVLKINGIVGTNDTVEREWLNKWSTYNIPISPLQYRVFRQYIGDNINIIPEEISHLVIEPVLNSKMASGYYSDKNFFDKILSPKHLPPTILRKIRGHFYDKDYSHLSIDNSLLRELLSTVKSNKIIIKPSVDGESGRGVMMFIYSDKDDNWKTINGTEILSANFLQNHCGDDIIVQEALEQHPDIAKFNESSINTLRLSVYRSVKDDVCHITGAIMRIGNYGCIVDNAHQGGRFVGINKNGLLCNAVLNQYGQICHTFNGIDFTQEHHYPEWEKVTSFAKEVCKNIIHNRLIALDICLDKNGIPKLIEFNSIPGCYSTWLFQYTVGPAFMEFTDEILEYCSLKIKETPLHMLK